MGKLEEEKNPRGRRMMFGCLGVLVGVIVAVWIWIGPLFLTAKKKGFLDPEIKRTYDKFERHSHGLDALSGVGRTVTICGFLDGRDLAKVADGGYG
jgi:hypothetical protein